VLPESERVFLDAMEDARFLPPLANWRKIEALVQAELSEVLLVEGTDVAAACARMAAKTDAYLARERERAGRPRLASWVMETAVAVAILGLVGLWLARRGPREPLLAREERGGLCLIAPWAAGFLAFLLGPAVVSLVLAFCEWSPLRPFDDVRFAGAENWSRLAADPTFRTSLGATALYALVSVPLGLAVALALALLLQSETTLAAVVRTLVYVPAIVAPVIAGALWRWIFEADRGLLNAALRAAGIEGPAWLRDPDWVLSAFVVMSVWAVGAQMLVFLAALKALDPTLAEAARIDGAGAWRRLWHVTIPQLTPVILFNLVTGTAAAFQIFAQAFVMTDGGPGDASRFLVLYLYETGFRHLDMGYASAVAWALFLVLAVVTATFLWTSRSWVHYAGRSR
jgi:multiple sugar transport system permease protein